LRGAVSETSDIVFGLFYGSNVFVCGAGAAISFWISLISYYYLIWISFYLSSDLYFSTFAFSSGDINFESLSKAWLAYKFPGSRSFTLKKSNLLKTTLSNLS
jgi:hypothetical protein